MKLIDKIKNYFYDEDEPNTPIVEQQQEVKENPTIKSEPKQPEKTNIDVISERELFKSEPTFNFPIVFDDDDFKEEKVVDKRINTVITEQTKTVETTIEQHIFKPSPIISPVYGIINTEEITKPKTDSSDNLLNLYDENKKIDIDDVLGKVYEQKRVEIKKENYVETKTVTNEQPKEEPPFDFFKNIENEQLNENNSEKENTREKTKKIDEKLKSIDELLESTDDDDFYSLVDSMYKDKEEGDN